MNFDDHFNSDALQIGQLIRGMRQAYANGQNVMQYARKFGDSLGNSAVASLIAYDLQAGSYIAHARENPEERRQWCNQLADILDAHVTSASTLLEVGSGEATTLAGVVAALKAKPVRAMGFDISWSRCAFGRTWLAEQAVAADLFVADLFEIPLADSSIDVVYTSHSLEPNGGRERAAVEELLRVARRAVVLIEPIYELAGTKARARMEQHGYVRNLRQVAEDLGANVGEYRLLPRCGNPLNPSGLILLEKKPQALSSEPGDLQWRCPLTHAPLVASPLAYHCPETGIVYPVLTDIPLLRANHAVVASAYGAEAFEAGPGE